MSDPHHAPADPHGVIHDVDKPATLLGVFATVLLVSAVSIGMSVGVPGLGKMALPLQMTFSTIQAVVVLYFFMHLKKADRVVLLSAAASLFWMGILFVLFLSDYLTRAKYTY